MTGGCGDPTVGTRRRICAAAVDAEMVRCKVAVW